MKTMLRAFAILLILCLTAVPALAAGEDIDGLQNCVARKQHSAEEAADISLCLIL